MDVFGLLSYINKISLLVFFITALVVGYQFYILKKERNKTQTPLIPDFKEKNSSSEVKNFTRLPDSLTKKDYKTLNYSKLAFLIISLLTIVIVSFVVSLIKKNGSTNKTTLNKTPAAIPTKVPESLNPTDLPKPTTEELSPTEVVPTEIVPTVEILETVVPTAEPTEIILAESPSSTPETNPTEVALNQVDVLPETGSWGKGLLIIGVAISTIFFSFWF